MTILLFALPCACVFLTVTISVQQRACDESALKRKCAKRCHARFAVNSHDCQLQLHSCNNIYVRVSRSFRVDLKSRKKDENPLQSWFESRHCVMFAFFLGWLHQNTSSQTHDSLMKIFTLVLCPTMDAGHQIYNTMVCFIIVGNQFVFTENSQTWFI